MVATEQIKISKFINDIQSISPEQAKSIESIRELFNKASHDLSEEIKYGGLVFFKSDSLIGGIFPYKKHISIEFSNGVDFNDPHELLEGKGKRRRHLKIHMHQDINSKNAGFFIEQSLMNSLKT